LKLQRYIALIHGETGTYGISFPDFPGCISGADSIEEAIAEGTRALALHVEGMRHDGEAVPGPRNLEAIRSAKEEWVDLDDAVIAVVPLLPHRAKSVRVNISMDQAILDLIDREATARSMNRSEFLTQAALEVLGGATRQAA
jgi:predicted RNase H-like HicB family nuclease